MAARTGGQQSGERKKEERPGRTPSAWVASNGQAVVTQNFK